MPKLVFDYETTGNHYFETGVRNVVLYVHDGTDYTTGVPWNGVTGITENPSGAEATPLYANDHKYLNLISAEEFGATVEAYTFPDEFLECDGGAALASGVTLGQQPRKRFGLCYRTSVGSDVDPSAANAYKIHLIYGATAAPSEKSYATMNESPEAMTLSWELSTVPISVPGFSNTASITIDSRTVNDAEKMAALEEIIYGGEGTGKTAHLPTITELTTIFGGATGATGATS